MKFGKRIKSLSDFLVIWSLSNEKEKDKNLGLASLITFGTFPVTLVALPTNARILCLHSI